MMNPEQTVWSHVADATMLTWNDPSSPDWNVPTCYCPDHGCRALLMTSLRADVCKVGIQGWSHRFYFCPRKLGSAVSHDVTRDETLDGL